MLRSVLLSLAVCALSFWYRLPLLLQSPPCEGAGVETERVAVALLRGHGWSDAYGEGTGPTAHVAPLYPLLLSGLYGLFGTYETPGGCLAQRCLSLAAVTCVLLLLPALGRKMGLSVTAGWAAAFVGAWLPAHQEIEVSGRHEQGLALLVLLGLIWGCASLQQGAWRGRRVILATGILLGVAALLCPNLLLAPALFFLIELLCRSGERQEVLRGSVALAAICLAFLSPWAARNYLVLGGFVPLRSNFGLELAIGNRPGANGHTYAPGFDEIHPYCNPAERERLIQLGELAYMRDKQRQALTWIADNPAQFATLTWRRARLFWFTPDERWCRLQLRPLLRYRIYGILGFGTLLGLGCLLGRRRPAGILMACNVFGVCFPYCITHVDMRYGLPLVALSTLVSCDITLSIARGVVANAVAPLLSVKEDSETCSPSGARAILIWFCPLSNRERMNKTTP